MPGTLGRHFHDDYDNELHSHRDIANILGLHDNCDTLNDRSADDN
jgi:hypothetical protein